MKRLTKIESYFIKTEKIALVVLIGLMVLLSFLQVSLRLTVGKSILWLDPLLRYFVLWVGFLGASIAVATNKHFALDVLTQKFKPKLNKLTNIVNRIFTSAVCIVLMYAAVKFVKSEISFGAKLFSIGLWQVPAIYMEFMIPLGFGLIIFHSLAGIFKEK
ncbi:MAG TPA: TRAP transporter small permease subunit [Elusimicrobiales bacterium]|nr:TRAP transporter small permease subunit [Elusimicrobiales bacterium]